MMSRQSRILLLCLILLSIRALWMPSIHSESTAFPIGLSLRYHIDQEVQGTWEEEYTIINWAAHLGEHVLQINVSSTQEGEPRDIHLDIRDWMILYENGSSSGMSLQYPLWVELDQWHEGRRVSIPTSPHSYFTRHEYIHIASGTYPCWQAYLIGWPLIDDDIQLTDEHWYFHEPSGILLKHLESLTPSQHLGYSYTYTRELIASNLMSFQVYSIEEQHQQLLFTFLLSTLALVPILSASGYLLKRRTRTRDIVS
jgi:hypothetical protein